MSKDHEWRDDTTRRAFEFANGEWSMSAWHLRELVRDLAKRVECLEGEIDAQRRRNHMGPYVGPSDRLPPVR